ncbi:MAG: DUF177 domain-containing protein [Candidatus Eisenbacteria bacterium]
MDAIRIDLSAINEGVNQFSFRVGPEEIDLEEENGLYRKPVELDLEVVRTGAIVTVRGKLRTEVERTCGRCLVRYDEPLETEIREALRIDGERVRVFDEEYEGDPGYLSGPAGSLSLGEVAREAVLVCSPMQPVCRPDCRGLCPECGADRNRVDCGCKTEVPHPVWEALRKLTEGHEKRD